MQAASQIVQECQAQAAECRAQANLTKDPAVRARLLEMEQQWLWLARSTTLAERLDEFVADLKRPCPSVARAAALTRGADAG